MKFDLLMWKESHPTLHDNTIIAENRLEILIKKLNPDKLFHAYDEYF